MRQASRMSVKRPTISSFRSIVCWSDAVLQPVDEEGESLAPQFVGEQAVELVVPVEEHVNGLGCVGRRLVGTVLEESLHAVDAIGNVEVEGLLAELLGEDQLVDVDHVLPALL